MIPLLSPCLLKKDQNPTARPTQVSQQSPGYSAKQTVTAQLSLSDHSAADCQTLSISLLCPRLRQAWKRVVRSLALTLWHQVRLPTVYLPLHFSWTLGPGSLLLSLQSYFLSYILGIQHTQYTLQTPSDTRLWLPWSSPLSSCPPPTSAKCSQGHTLDLVHPKMKLPIQAVFHASHWLTTTSYVASVPPLAPQP